MLGNLLEKVLKEDENDYVSGAKDEIASKKDEIPEKKSKRINIKSLWLPILIFLIALTPRLYFLFSHDTQNIGYDWYGDVYHHWQIAYLTKTVGLSHGFLRLWDLKGMEYFWGLLQPLVLVIIFTITNSSNIVILRLLSIFCSSIVIALVFLIVKREFNASAAWASALFLIFMPVILFSDTLGMQEPLSLMLLLLGVYLWPKHPVITGFCWAFAAMNRADYWLFSIGLFIAAVLERRKVGERNPKPALILSWIIPIVLYMKYLASYTGNYIYPIYWNFLASVVGDWFEKRLNPYFPHLFLDQTKIIMFALFVVGIISALWVIIKKYKSYLFYLTGIFNLILVGFMFSVAAYTWGYIDRFWVDRLFAWPYGFIGIMASIFFLYYLPRKLKIWRILRLGWIVMLLLLLATQISWKMINNYWDFAKRPWEATVEMAKVTADGWNKQGNILLPENQPHYIYALVQFNGIKGKQIIGEMYDPFYYITGKETTEEMDIKFIDWLKENNITYIVVNSVHDTQYTPIFQRHPDIFKYINAIYSVKLYEFL